RGPGDDRVMHLLRALHSYELHAGAGRKARGRHEHDARASAGGDVCERVAHLPRRSVSDVTHRIERLASAARAHDDGPAGEGTVPGEEHEHGVGDPGGIREPARADVTA